MTDNVYETLDRLAATETEKHHLTYALRSIHEYSTGELDYEHLGDFVRAVVRNDLLVATRRADRTNYKFLRTIATFAAITIPENKRNRNAFRK